VIGIQNEKWKWLIKQQAIAADGSKDEDDRQKAGAHSG
jgi:hypothetical protein